MSEYIVEGDEENPWIIVGGIVLALIFAPFLLPFNLGIYIHKNS